MMDDWEPPWRGRGIKTLDNWWEKVPAETMRRMGIDKLLINSLIHTLSLHANPPLKGVLPITLRFLERATSGEGKAERYAEIMDKAIIQGWTYAPSGLEGRPVLIDIAGKLQLLCSVFGIGIIRWLKVSQIMIYITLMTIHLRLSSQIYFNRCNFLQH